MSFICNAAKNLGIGWGNIICNGFSTQIDKVDKPKKIPILASHFYPLNKWEYGQISPDTKKPYEMIDQTTGDHYVYESPNRLRAKCAATFAATIPVQGLGLFLNVINRVGKLLTFAHFWHRTPGKHYNFIARLKECGKDILRIVMTPLILIAMFFTSLYGAILRPYDGRKLYASLERFAYGGGYQTVPRFGKHQPNSFFIDPTFQPEFKGRLGGGNMKKNKIDLKDPVKAVTLRKEKILADYRELPPSTSKNRERIAFPDACEPGLSDMVKLMEKFPEHYWMNIEVLLRAYDNVELVEGLLSELPTDETFIVQEGYLKKV